MVYPDIRCEILNTTKTRIINIFENRLPLYSLNYPMKIKKLTKYTIYAVAVLSAALINEQISKYVKQHIDQQGYILVLIDMGIIVLIFAPAFGLVNKYTKKISQVYLKTSRKKGLNPKNYTSQMEIPSFKASNLSS